SSSSLDELGIGVPKAGDPRELGLEAGPVVPLGDRRPDRFDLVVEEATRFGAIVIGEPRQPRVDRRVWCEPTPEAGEFRPGIVPRSRPGGRARRARLAAEPVEEEPV